MITSRAATLVGLVAAMAITAPALAQTANTYQGGPLGVMQGGEGNVNQHYTGSYHYSSGGSGGNPAGGAAAAGADPTAQMPAWMNGNGGGSGPFNGWVFQDDGRGGGQQSLERSMHNVQVMTQGAVKLMDGAADAAAAADRMDARMGGDGGGLRATAATGGLWVGPTPQAGASSGQSGMTVMPGIGGGVRMTTGGVVVEDRGQSSATVTIDGPQGRMMRRE